MPSESLDRALSRIAREVAASRETLQTVSRGLGALRQELGGDAPFGEGVPLVRTEADVQTTVRLRPGREGELDPDSLSTAKLQRPDTTPTPTPPSEEETPRRETLPLAPLELQEISEAQAGVIVDLPPPRTPAAGHPMVPQGPREPVPSTITPTGRQAKLRPERKLRDTQTYPFGSEPPPPGTSAEAIDRAAGLTDDGAAYRLAGAARPVDTVDLFFGAESEQRLEDQIKAQLAKKDPDEPPPDGEKE